MPISQVDLQFLFYLMLKLKNWNEFSIIPYCGIKFGKNHFVPLLVTHETFKKSTKDTFSQTTLTTQNDC